MRSDRDGPLEHVPGHAGVVLEHLPLFTMLELDAPRPRRQVHDEIRTIDRLGDPARIQQVNDPMFAWNISRPVSPMHQRDRLRTDLYQRAQEVLSDEPVAAGNGDPLPPQPRGLQRDTPCSVRSASTISATRSSKVISGSHPTVFLARDGSDCR